jgi:hypothetical protein
MKYNNTNAIIQAVPKLSPKMLHSNFTYHTKRFFYASV